MNHNKSFLSMSPPFHLDLWLFRIFFCSSHVLGEEENEKVILDLSRKQLKKVPKQEEAQNVRTLLLDENELQKIDNIDSYLKIEKVNVLCMMTWNMQTLNNCYLFLFFLHLVIFSSCH